MRQALHGLQVSLVQSFLRSRYYPRLVAVRLEERRPVGLDQFEVVRVLGEGGFGKVFAVLKAATKAVYACKAMNKRAVTSRQRQVLVLNERNVLSVVSHPFLVSLKYAFQDEHTLYLVQDLLTGGELQFHLNREGRFPEHIVQFFAAGLVLALGHLHARNLVYRDVKPGNILLDADGSVPRLHRALSLLPSRARSLVSAHLFLSLCVS
jgi:serine/threonine protein kinase